MSAEWDAIVVGGGVVGLATAHALTRNGAERVLVLERYIVGSGTTSRGTGAVQVHRFSRTDNEMVARSKTLMKEISDAVGAAFTYYEVGRLSIAPAEHAQDLQDSVYLARDCGIDVSVLDAEQASAYVPGIDMSDVALATYSPHDGRIYSNTLATALAGVTRDAGTVIWEGVDVQGIEFDESGHVSGVRVGYTTTTLLRSRRVVVAAGAWTRNVLIAAGLSFPTRKRIARTATVLIKDNAGCLPVPTFLDAIHELTYIPRNPDLIQIGGHRPGLVVEPALDLSQGNEIMPREELMVGFDDMFACLRQRFPGWTFGPIVGGWSGLIDVSPDGQPLVGAYPGVDGLWLNDTAGYGLMRSMAIGEAVAALMLGEEPPVNVSPWDVNRLATLEQPAAGQRQTTSPFKGIATVEPRFDPIVN